MEFDKRLAYAAIVALFAISIVYAFSGDYFQDSDYGLLNASGMGAEMAKSASLALFILLPFAIYIAGAYAFKADPLYSATAAIIFTLAGLNTESLYSLAPVLGTAIGKSYALETAVKSAAILAALGFPAFINYKKEKVPAALFVAGLVILPFAPGIGIFLLAITAACGIGLIEGSKYREALVGIAAFAFVFQGMYSGNIAPALASGAFMAVLIYVIGTLHQMKTPEISGMLLIFIAFLCLMAVNSVPAINGKSITAQEISAYKFAGAQAGNVGIFDYPMAFEYYSGKKANVINSSEFVRKGQASGGLVLFSARSLDSAYGERAIVFYYAGTSNTSTSDVEVFINKKYAIYMSSANGGLALENAVLTDFQTGEMAEIPFTRIRMLFNSTYKDNYNRMVNTQEILESPLQKALFGSELVYENNGTRLVRVQ